MGCLGARLGKPGGRRSDPLLGLLAVAGVLLWHVGTLSSAQAAVCAVGCDVIALWPTVREAWRQPELESLASWTADLIGNGLCVCALASASPASIAFPGYLLAAAAVMVTILVVRRRQGRWLPEVAAASSRVPIVRPSDVLHRLT